MKRIRLIFILVLALLPVYVNASENFNLEFQGALINQSTYYQLKSDTLLNPDSKLALSPQWENKFYENSSINLTYKEWFNLGIKTRPVWTINNEEGSNLENSVDDACVDIRFRDTSFLTIGKQNLQEGVGLSYNPTDFLAQEKEMDYSKREEERKKEREGDYLIRLEKITEGLTLSLLLAPRIDNLQKEGTRGIIKLYSLVGNTDIAVSYLNGKLPKSGINLSSVIGSNIEFHTEAGLNKGSNRKFLRKKKEVGPPNSGVYGYEIYDPEEDDKVFTKALVGGHYTFCNKTNLIVEYFFNEDGYSQSEWDDFIGLVKDANLKFKEPPAGFSNGLFAENLRLANACMTFRSLRKNYLFFRLSNPEIFNYYDGQLSMLLNIDDGSMAIMPSIDYKKFGDIVVRFGLNWFSGDPKSEFNLVPYTSEFQLGARYFF